ncbi:hypothetical protein [Devosia alba]|uniref:hypothetical protein n=1 Tax=Devosia alba TaxID=3152360 RepID=UPI003267DD05
MKDANRSFRQVPVGAATPQSVTVGIDSDGAAGHKAAVWWEAVADVDADKTDFIDVAAALDAAEGARALHGFSEVVVMLQDGVKWQSGWGELRALKTDNEPLGDVSGVGLSDAESFELAADIEAERDA